MIVSLQIMCVIADLTAAHEAIDRHLLIPPSASLTSILGCLKPSISEE
jgi:hypothetical protein